MADEKDEEVKKNDETPKILQQVLTELQELKTSNATYLTEIEKIKEKLDNDKKSQDTIVANCRY